MTHDCRSRNFRMSLIGLFLALLITPVWSQTESDSGPATSPAKTAAPTTQPASTTTPSASETSTQGERAPAKPQPKEPARSESPAPTATTTPKGSDKTPQAAKNTVPTKQPAPPAAVEKTSDQSVHGSAPDPLLRQEVLDRLDRLEQSVSDQKSNEVDLLKELSRLTLIIAGAVAGIAILALFGIIYLHSRALSRIPAAYSPASLPGQLRVHNNNAALTVADTQPATGNSVAIENAQSRFRKAVERLEQRIQSIEGMAGDHAQPDTVDDAETHATAQNADEAASPQPDEDAISILLSKGQTLLNAGRIDDAIACFDEAIAAAPDRPDAYVKKGTGLEKLQRHRDAFEAYEKAIEVDPKYAAAYLQKAGLLNRLERYSEALDCYESAIQNQARKSVDA